MKITTAFLAALLMLPLTGTAHAIPALTSSTNWNSLGPPDVQVFGNSFTSTGQYTDGYFFELSGGAGAFGGVIEVGTLFNRLNIDVTSVSLFKGDTLIGTDVDPLYFSFSNLSAGSGYLLVVTAVVTRDPGFWTIPVGYAGLIATVSQTAEPAPPAVPIPGALPLFMSGFGALSLLAYRRKRKLRLSL